MNASYGIGGELSVLARHLPTGPGFPLVGTRVGGSGASLMMR
jgi:hypothetical protein